jgi:protein-tyrosine-phosphatase
MNDITILFMCPHGAAKSVLAAAYCGRMAAERGLGWRIMTAGTEPDDELAAVVVKLLQEEGLPVPAGKPHRVTAAELDTADWIVSMGCDLTGLVGRETAVEHWEDVPPTSQDLMGAKRVIKDHLEAFMNRMAE